MSEAVAARERRGWTRALAAALLAVLLGAWLLAPWFAFLEVRSAAAVGDRAGLEAVADLAAVRTGLRPQLLSSLSAPGAAHSAAQARPWWLPGFIPWDPRAGAGAIIGGWSREQEAGAEAERLASPAGLACLATGRATVSHWGTRWFRIDVTASGAAKGRVPTTFTFTRKGLFKWALTHVRLSRMAIAQCAGRSPSVQP